MDKSKLLVAASLVVIISMVLCLVPMEESEAVDVSDYAGLTAAISSSDGPTTITLIDDVESNSQISIVPGKDIVLDLNGNNITIPKAIINIYRIIYLRCFNFTFFHLHRKPNIGMSKI